MAETWTEIAAARRMVQSQLVARDIHDQRVLRAMSVVGVTVLFVTTAGTFFSSLFARTSTATAWTYAVVLTLGLVSLMALLAEDLFSPRLIRAVFLVNPVAAVLDAAGSRGMQEMNLYVRHLQIMGAGVAALFVVTVARVFQLRGRD